MRYQTQLPCKRSDSGEDTRRRSAGAPRLCSQLHLGFINTFCVFPSTQPPKEFHSGSWAFKRNKAGKCEHDGGQKSEASSAGWSCDQETGSPSLDFSREADPSFSWPMARGLDAPNGRNGLMNRICQGGLQPSVCAGSKVLL